MLVHEQLTVPDALKLIYDCPFSEGGATEGTGRETLRHISGNWPLCCSCLGPRTSGCEGWVKVRDNPDRYG